MNAAPPRTVSRIKARSSTGAIAYIRECWERRGLVGVLAGRELKSAYEMNIVGFAWWLLEPLSLTLVYVVLFDVILKSNVPSYPLFILLALLPFKWLSQSLLGSMGTMRANASLVTDVYFPRALLPFADTVTGLAHYLVGLLIVPLFMAAYGVGPSPYLFYLPVVIAAQLVLTLGLAYPLAVWGVYYRNLPNLVGNLLRLWLYLSPALWALSSLSESHQTLVRLNPLTGIFEGYRGAFGLVLASDGRTLIHQAPGWDLVLSAGIGFISLLIGGLYFIRREAQFGKLL